ncbi:uncharacterized protein LOC113323077 [Papaver somniferum]|uniref:uncharacterized protein LOC113323077 n=1 Tax=Papaver somniferum TaxID=3469 RepID=UPI000E6F696F|nr:uncharacterized protein LOC113323077 [Papaver somniferum]
MPAKGSWGFSLFGNGSAADDKIVDGSVQNSLSPSLRLQLDKDVYRPGDLVSVTIEIHNPCNSTDNSETQHEDDDACSLLVERLGFEIKGTEKLDTQWFSMQRPFSGTKHRRGEQVFLDCSTPHVISNQIVSSGATKTYIVRTELPDSIPPSYRGTTIRYFYCVRTTLSGRFLALERGSRRDLMKETVLLEDRIPLQIWVSQKTSGLLNEDQSDGILQATTIPMDIYWKEKDSDSEWARANETSDGGEEGYDSSRDETSSVSSYNPSKGNLNKALGSSLSLQSAASRFSNKDVLHLQGERSSLSSYLALPHVSVAEVIYDSSGDVLSPDKKSHAVLSPSPSKQRKHPFSSGEDTIVPPIAETSEPVASEGFVRGRSYNIRLDDQVLLRFSPKNSDSTYYFSDMIGGTLTFFHEEGARRCLEVSITLETSETISQKFVHPSRRNAPVITKIQSDRYEVVADLVQTSFLFSIPMDGPMSFATPLVSVQWALRFEFFTTPKNVDWTRYEHPLLIEGRDKGEWVLPITVHAPPPRAQPAHTRSERPDSLGPIWNRN